MSAFADASWWPLLPGLPLLPLRCVRAGAAGLQTLGHTPHKRIHAVQVPAQQIGMHAPAGSCMHYALCTFDLASVADLADSSSVAAAWGEVRREIGMHWRMQGCAVIVQCCFQIDTRTAARTGTAGEVAAVAPVNAPVFLMEYCTVGSLSYVLAQGNVAMRDAQDLHAHSSSSSSSTPSIRAALVSVSLLSQADRARIALDVAEALHALHEQVPLRLMHLDVRTANVLLSRDAGGRVMAKLNDFGGAQGQTLTRGEQWIQRPPDHLCAPEQLRDGERVTYKTDVWGFGMLLLELLAEPSATPATPYATELTAAKQLILHGRLPICQLASFLHHSLLPLLRQCWSADPHLRPDMGDVLRQLKEYLQPLIAREEQVASGAVAAAVRFVATDDMLAKLGGEANRLVGELQARLARGGVAGAASVSGPIDPLQVQVVFNQIADQGRRLAQFQAEDLKQREALRKQVQQLQQRAEHRQAQQMQAELDMAVQRAAELLPCAHCGRLIRRALWNTDVCHKHLGSFQLLPAPRCELEHAWGPISWLTDGSKFGKHREHTHAWSCCQQLQQNAEGCIQGKHVQPEPDKIDRDR